MSEGVPSLVTGFAVDADGIARGFVLDPAEPSSRFVVEILADGLPVALLRAHEADDAPPEGSDGCHGFAVRIADEVLARARRIEARLANSHVPVGAAVAGALGFARTEVPAWGSARYSGGLRISGWTVAATGSDRLPIVKALIDGTEVARAACDAWIDTGHGRIRPAFRLDLPERLADGRVHPVEVVGEDGEQVPGSPCLVVAFRDGLAELIDEGAEIESERVRARFADGILPRVWPFSEVEDWLLRFPPPRAALAEGPRVAVVIVGEVGLDATLASLEGQEGVDWSAAALTGGSSRLSFDPLHLRAFLGDLPQDCALVMATVSGATFAPGALAALHEALARHPDAPAVYPDVLTTVGGRRWPVGFPAFDDEFYLETGFCGLCFGLRRDVAADAALRGLATLHALFPARDGGVASGAPVHLPALLATLPELPAADLQASLLDATRARLAARGVEARVTAGPRAGGPSARVRRPPPRGDTSVLLAVRDDGPALGRTLASLAATGRVAAGDVVLADGGSTDPATLAALDQAGARGHRVLRVPGGSCAPRILGRAAAAARGDNLLFLEPGLVGAEEGWLDEMLGRLGGRDVGAVGGLVAWDTGVVRDAGFALGPRMTAAARFADRVVGDDGAAGLLAAAHQCSALSAACLLTPRSLFAAVGGFDALRFPTRLYAADYGLRLRERGRRVVLTPHARLTQTSRPGIPPGLTDLRPVAEREEALFRHRWSVAPGCDPFYTPWMAMDDTPYSGMAWPPARLDARQPAAPVARSIPPGF